MFERQDKLDLFNHLISEEIQADHALAILEACDEMEFHAPPAFDLDLDGEE